ncbi:MAG: M23 family metallopeptidase [Desulfobulbaceae bacterium]|nr:M23 family metallopeptidase [Desulfobulbaceae bacterium]
MALPKKIFVLSFVLALFTLFFIISTIQYRLDHSQATAIASLPPEVATYEESNAHNFTYKSLIEGELRSGDTLSSSLSRDKLSPTVKKQVVSQLAQLLDFRRLRPQDKYRIYLDDQGELIRCEYESSPFDCYSVTKKNDSFVTQKDIVDLKVEVFMAEGKITSSLFNAFAEQKIKAPVIYAFADIFSSRIDFNTETQKDDSFRLVYEKYFKDDKFVGFGNILYARYEQKNGLAHEAYYYQTDSKLGAYFDNNGREMGASFIKSPVPMGRVTSKFTWRRKHPVSGVVKPHLGVDLAAPVGTPVMAAADGKVAFVGRKGGFGRQIILAHAGGYKTHYGHLYRFARGLKKGDIVSQKQVIGFVGSSGVSTGPHLDYRLQHHSQFLNPFAMNFKPKSFLEGDELASFKGKADGLIRLINTATAPDTLYVRHCVVKPGEHITLL